MTESHRHAVEVEGVVLQVHDDGSPGQPCVVLAHSIMTNATMWTPQLRYLRALGYRVLRPESRGHGGSGNGHGELTIDRLAADIVQTLDQLNIERVHYVGLSLGGMVGFSLGQRHAARLESLVICDARADSPPAFAQPWNDRIDQARAQGMASLVQPTLERWFGARLERVDREMLAQLRESMANTSLDGFVSTARALQDFDYTHGLTGMPQHTTLIVGEHDGVLPLAMADLAQRMPQCKLEVIPGAGHLPNVEHPASFNEALRRALDGS